MILIKNDPRALDAVTSQTMDCAHVPKVLAAKIAESAARRELFVGEQNTSVSLGILKKAIRVLSEMPGERLIVLASPGFFAQTSGAISSVADVLNLAIRSKVMISALDARGLYTVGLMDASRQTQPSTLERQYYRESARADEDVLADLAEGTGGTFFRHNNDLTLGLARASEAPEFSYVLGFTPSSMKPDGSFHPLKIRLSNQKGFNIQARHGYYALKPDSEQDAAAAEIHDAVFSREEMRGIPPKVQMQLAKLNSGDTRLTVLAKLDVRSLHLKKANGRNRDSLTVVSALFDPEGSYVTGMSQTVNLALLDETLASMDSIINVPSDFDVKRGTYLVRVVVSESEGKAISAYNGAVPIP